MIITIITVLFNYDVYNHLYIKNMPILMGIDIVMPDKVGIAGKMR